MNNTNTMEINEGLLEMGNLLVAQSSVSDSYHAILKSAAKKAVEVFNCDRCCLILKNKRDELIIKAGFPSDCHGIGQKISEQGESFFLNEVIKNKRIVQIEDPLNDERMNYMRELIESYSITSIIFAPIFYLCEHGDCIGVMVLDSTDGNKISINYKEISLMTGLLGLLIKQEYKKMEK